MRGGGVRPARIERPGEKRLARFGPIHRGEFVSSRWTLWSHRPAYTRVGVLAHVCRHQVEVQGGSPHRLRRSLRGQSWAEKSLKNGRFLVEFQKLRKPQDAKGTYFPRHLPSALLEWGSGALRRLT